MWSRRIQGLIQPDRQFPQTFLSILFVKVRFADFGVLLKTPSGAVEIQALDARMWSRMIQGLILPDRQFLQTFLSILFVKVRAAGFGVLFEIAFCWKEFQALYTRMGSRFLPLVQFPQTFLSILFVKVRVVPSHLHHSFRGVGWSRKYPLKMQKNCHWSTGFTIFSLVVFEFWRLTRSRSSHE